MKMYLHSNMHMYEKIWISITLSMLYMLKHQALNDLLKEFIKSEWNFNLNLLVVKCVKIMDFYNLFETRAN